MISGRVDLFSFSKLKKLTSRASARDEPHLCAIKIDITHARRTRIHTTSSTNSQSTNTHAAIGSVISINHPETERAERAESDGPKSAPKIKHVPPPSEIAHPKTSEIPAMVKTIKKGRNKTNKATNIKRRNQVILFSSK